MMIDSNRMILMCGDYGIKLSGRQLEQLDQYARLLAEWNTKINLTAITEPEEVAQKHFFDSLVLASQPEAAGKLVDVGSGAGFPGMVAKLYRPENAVTLMEPTGKRLKFLEAVSEALGLEVALAKERAEEAARKQWREGFDVATARAVAALPALCEYCLPLVRVGGWFIAMKGGEVEAELASAESAIKKLGGGKAEVRRYSLPAGDARTLVLIPKVGKTPPAYPRNGGTIAKRPL